MEENKKIANIPEPDYDKARLDFLKEALKRTYKERFLMATRLYKVHQTLSKAKITHKSLIKK